MHVVSQCEAQLASATNIVERMVNGEWQVGDQASGESGKLIQALYRLSDRLQKIASEEGQRAWANEGLAKFMNVLRQRGSTTQLADEIMRFIIKYLEVNQGALYLSEGEGADTFLEMKACYAYERKRYIQHRVNPGEGLVGQAALEKETLYLKDIPRNYIKITSGLGEALPGNLAIVPLMNDGFVVGVLEIASFQSLTRHQLTFLEKAGESIASVLVARQAADKLQHLVDAMQHQAALLKEQDATMRRNLEQLAASEEEMKRAKVNAERLLVESQEQTQRLVTQEEELRQNLEQMDAQSEAIQEQIRNSERIRKELATREEVFGYTTILSETDKYGNIIYVNDKFCEVSGFAREELIGKPQNIVRHPDTPKEVFKAMWATIKAGNVFNGIIKNRCKDGSHYWVDVTIVPVKDENGAIVKYIGARYHIKTDALAQQLVDLTTKAA